MKNTTNTEKRNYYIIQSVLTGLFFDGKTGCNANFFEAKQLDHVGALFVARQFDNVRIVSVI